MPARGWRELLEELKRRGLDLLADLDELLTIPPEPQPVPVRPDDGRRGGSQERGQRR